MKEHLRGGISNQSPAPKPLAPGAVAQVGIADLAAELTRLVQVPDLNDQEKENVSNFIEYILARACDFLLLSVTRFNHVSNQPHC